MNDAVRTLDFETAAILRDEIRALEAERTPKKKNTHRNTKHDR